MHRGPFNVVPISFSYSQSWYWPPYGHTVILFLSQTWNLFNVWVGLGGCILNSRILSFSAPGAFCPVAFFLPTLLTAMPPGRGRRGLSFSWVSQRSFYLFPRIGETYFCLQNVTLSFLYEQWQQTLNTRSSTCCLSDFSLEFLRSVTDWLLRCVLCFALAVFFPWVVVSCSSLVLFFVILFFALFKMTLILCPSNLFSAVRSCRATLFP